jgi:AraC family transcriptional regulator
MIEAPPTMRPVPARAGDLVRAVAAGPFHFSESRHRVPLTRHAHERPTITILLDGAYEETLARRVVEAHVPASVLFRPAGEPHSDRFGQSGALNLVIEVDPGRAEALRCHTSLLDEIACLRLRGVDALARRMHGELVTGDGLAPMALEGMALELLAAASRDHATLPRERSVPPWLVRARELLEARFADPTLRVAELAEAVGVHPVHFARAFRAQFGHSPSDHVRTLRLEWTARELRQGGRALADIAAAAGFVDQSHLTRAFRRRFGVTPGRFRRR